MQTPVDAPITEREIPVNSWKPMVAPKWSDLAANDVDDGARFGRRENDAGARRVLIVNLDVETRILIARL